MNYAHFYEQIGAVYNVEAVGWLARFVNPSDLSNSILPLVAFRDALIAGTCYFRKLTPPEARERAATYRAGVSDGTITPLQRKTRKDKGMKKTNPTGKRAAKSRQVVSDSEDGEGNEDESHGPDEMDYAARATELPVTGSSQCPRPRRRTNATGIVSAITDTTATATAAEATTTTPIDAVVPAGNPLTDVSNVNFAASATSPSDETSDPVNSVSNKRKHKSTSQSQADDVDENHDGVGGELSVEGNPSRRSKRKTTKKVRTS
jgi:hypothetical protein